MNDLEPQAPKPKRGRPALSPEEALARKRARARAYKKAGASGRPPGRPRLPPEEALRRKRESKRAYAQRAKKKS